QQQLHTFPTRRSSDLLKAKHINATHTETDEVINYFRDADTSFIMPPSNTKLYPGLMLDISHESLMRNWPDLKEWMKEEVNAADRSEEHTSELQSPDHL